MVFLPELVTHDCCNFTEEKKVLKTSHGSDATSHIIPIYASGQPQIYNFVIIYC